MIIVDHLQLPYVEKDISLRIEGGLSILSGMNGSGKSILLDYISGIRWAGNAIRGNEDILYLSQNIYFSNRLTAKDFLKFIYRMDNQIEYQQSYFKFMEPYPSVDIYAHWNKAVGMLSGGERNLLFMTALLSLNRSWYILDEPFTAIDTGGKDVLLDLIGRRLAQGKNIILVTHEEKMVERLMIHQPQIITLDEIL